MRRLICRIVARDNPIARKLLLIGALLHCGAIGLQAQARQEQNVPAASRFELAITYSSVNAGQVYSKQFWMNGGGIEIAARIHRSLSVAVNFTGLHTSNTGTGVPLNLVTSTFGPRYTWTTGRRSSNGHSLSIFGEGLVGEACGFNSLFPGSSGVDSSSNSPAVQAGGGVEIALSRHLSVHAVQASWLRTQLPNSSTNVQNDFQIGAGFVFHSADR